MIFEKTDPWLRTHTPPWEFGCNCKLEQITAKRAGKTPTMIRPPTPPEKVHVESKSGYTFDPETVFKEFDFELIKNDVLRKEAKAGVGKILAEKHPEYKNIDYRPDKKPTEELHVGMNAVGSVWKKTELKKIPVEFMQSTNKNLAGETNIDGSGRVTSMKVYSNSVHPALSLVHETGHVIDYVFLRTLKKQEAKQKLLNVLRSSEGYQKMQQELDQLRNQGKLSKRKQKYLELLEYHLNDDEVIARGFAQYISEKNTGYLLEEFQKDVMLRPNLYFQGNQMQKEKLQLVFEKLLKGII